MRNILILCTFIFAALAAIYFFVGSPKVYGTQFTKAENPHLYNDADRKVSDIKIFAVYFIPKNKEEFMRGDWQDLVSEALGKLDNFHMVQFQGTSNINYYIYPSPVVGLYDSLYYDTEDTQNGNPQALLNVSSEIEKRIFKPTGDLYSAEFASLAGDYSVVAILYEGVGAVGGIIYESELGTKEEISRDLGLPESVIHIVDIESFDGFFLVNRVYLSEPEYADYGVSIFAHEFYHTLGISDKYKSYEETPISEDIMGLGRLRPIEKTYVEKETLKRMGL